MHPLQQNFRNYRKFCVPFARNLGFSLSTERELTWAFAKMAAVAAYQCSACGFVANDISLFLQATAARSIMSSLLSGMVQLVISHSSCSKAAKIFKKSAIFKHNKWSPSMPCVAGHVTTNPGKRSDAFHSTSENSENLNR